GTIFKMNQDGSGYRVLYNFTGAAGDASSPAAGLFEADDGALYGTTWYGGSTWNGTVFRVNRDGSNYAVVYSFLGTGGDGGAPRASVTEGSDGALYGTTYYGGDFNLGTAFYPVPPARANKSKPQQISTFWVGKMLLQRLRTLTDSCRCSTAMPRTIRPGLTGQAPRHRSRHANGQPH